jgi:hypothetical protein
MLEKLGVRWDDGINLLWPSHEPGKWDAREARRVAEVLMPEVLEYDVVILFGVKVCVAFQVKFEPCVTQGKFLPLPHPSGRCRLWNNEETHHRIRKVMKELLG